MAGVFNLGGILELVNDGLDDETLAYQQLVLEKDESISHVFANRCDQLQSLRVELLEESLGEIAAVANQLTPQRFGHLWDRFAVIGVGGRELNRQQLPLVAVIDWHSRYVLAWQLSNTLDGIFCLDALRQALSTGRPQIFNTDQGAQFTADAFTACLLAANIQVSMDGRGRALDNVFCERLRRSVKYENIYLNQYDTVRQLQTGLTAYFDIYNHESRHQRLNYRTPAEEHLVL